MITLTESAIQRVAEMMTTRENSIGLRVCVTESGCSGYRYALDFADELNDTDQVFEQGNVKIVVNEDSLALLDGIELDYVKQGLNQSFKFNNPNVVSSCGCGESFSVTK